MCWKKSLFTRVFIINKPTKCSLMMVLYCCCRSNHFTTNSPLFWLNPIYLYAIMSLYNWKERWMRFSDMICPRIGNLKDRLHSANGQCIIYLERLIGIDFPIHTRLAYFLFRLLTYFFSLQIKHLSHMIHPPSSQIYRDIDLLDWTL